MSDILKNHFQRYYSTLYHYKFYKNIVLLLLQKEDTVPRDQINPSQDEDRLASKITYSFKKGKKVKLSLVFPV